MTRSLAIILVCLLAPAFAFRSNLMRMTPMSSRSTVAIMAGMNSESSPQNLLANAKKGVIASFIATVAFSSLLPLSALAAEKSDNKAFELCLSKCVFAETRPPPVGADAERMEATSIKTRVEILRDCKVKCATNKDQLLVGKPKNKKSENVDATSASSSSFDNSASAATEK